MINVGDHAPQNQHSEQLQALTRRFQDLLDSFPPEINARQRMLTERRNGQLFVQVISSFRLASPDDS